MHHTFLTVLISISVFIACFPTKPVIESHAGMRRIAAAERYFTMGSTDTWASNAEKPAMRVGFTYDFWIDTTEVTVAAYYKTERRLPRGYTGNDTLSNLPVANITWFDAILYCNQRSLIEGFDTVYSYVSIERAADGRVYRVTGLKTDLAISGYRLPTEAEWEFAAHGADYTVFPWGDTPDTTSAKAIAWFGSNTAKSVLPVAGLAPNKYGLYDMFGNVMEWVNDYLGTFLTDTVRNYPGPAFNNLEERPVKGGGFVHTIEWLRASSRKDEYPTPSSTAERYIGMRCCFGAVGKQIGGLDPNLHYSDSSNPVQVYTQAAVQALPSREAKIVFVNTTGDRNNLCYADFNEADPQVYCFKDFSPVYAPTVSPDGRWVAFCTRADGARDGSRIYLRRLDATGTKLHEFDDSPAFDPRWWVDSLSGNVYLIYTSSAIDNQQSGWSSTSTKMRRIINGQPIGSSVTLEAGGSYHDGLSVDRRFLATGFTRLLMKDLVSGEVKTLFTAPQNGKPEGDTSQVCNVSICPDAAHSDRTLFIDFGNISSVSSVVGTSYGIHEIIFMSNFSGDVVSWYRCPENTVEWGYPEWSTVPEYAVATARPSSSPQQSREIYLIHLSDKKYTKIIEGTELSYPYLWVFRQPELSPLLSRDSLGYYNEPPSGDAQASFAGKMPEFWKLHDSIEVLCLGSSRIQNGVVPLMLEPFFAYNLGYTAGGLAGIENLLENYAVVQCPRLKAVVISVDICWFNLPDGDFSWNTINVSTGFHYDMTHDFWKTGLPKGFLGQMAIVDNPVIPELVESRGWYGDFSTGWGSTTPSYPAENVWSVNDHCTRNVERFKVIVDDLQKRGIHLVGIVFPMSPGYKNTPVFGAYGPTREAAHTLLNEIAAIDTQYTSFHLFDINNFGDHSYIDADARNESHLSTAGARKLTTWLKPVLDSLLQ